MLRKLIASNIIQEYTREQFCKKWWVKLLQMRKEDSNEAFSLSLETWKLIIDSFFKIFDVSKHIL